MSASRGTAIDRVLAFYRTASPDTVRVTHTLAVEVMADRGIGGKKVKQIVKRGRRSKSATSQTDPPASAASSSGGN